MAVDTLIIRSYKPEDEDDVLSLMKMALGDGPAGGRSSSLWQWKHFANIFGPSYVQVAADESGLVVGMRALMQWQFRKGEQTLRAVRAVDTATHPDFRRLGIFQSLTRSALEDVRRDGVDLVFNTPNQYSMPGYLKMGWQTVGVAQPLVHVLSPSNFAVGMVRRLTRGPGSKQITSGMTVDNQSPKLDSVLESDYENGEISALLARSDDVISKDNTVRTNSSTDFLRWRYAEHPFIEYHAVIVGSGSRIDALAVFRCNTRFGLREIVLTELFLSEPDYRLSQEVVHEIKKRVKADYIISYSHKGSLSREALRHSGFHPVPRYGITVTARTLDKELPFDLFNLNNWGFSLGDLELF